MIGSWTIQKMAVLYDLVESTSLPSGGWGYDHFPISARNANTLGMEYIGMTSDDFVSLCDQFRSPHLWEKRGSEWALRHTVA